MGLCCAAVRPLLGPRSPPCALTATVPRPTLEVRQHQGPNRRRKPSHRDLPRYRRAARNHPHQPAGLSRLLQAGDKPILVEPLIRACGPEPHRGTLVRRRSNLYVTFRQRPCPAAPAWRGFFIRMLCRTGAGCPQPLWRGQPQTSRSTTFFPGWVKRSGPQSGTQRV